jgi:hypothetical protein
MDLEHTNFFRTDACTLDKAKSGGTKLFMYQGYFFRDALSKRCFFLKRIKDKESKIEDQRYEKSTGAYFQCNFLKKDISQS